MRSNNSDQGAAAAEEDKDDRVDYVRVSKAFNRANLDTAGGSSDASTSLRDNKLNMLPKHNATTVQVKMMTLYGMLKSGVGSDNRRDVLLT